MAYTDPDYDKTNPRNPNWRIDPLQHPTYYDEEGRVNATDDALEASREDPELIWLKEGLSLYPDEFTRSHQDNSKNRQGLAAQETAVEDFYDSSVAFDQEGDEAEVEDARPLANE